MNTRKTIEAQLFDLITDHLDGGDLPPTSTILLVHHVKHHFGSRTRTVEEWLTDDEAIADIAVRIEASISRRALADRLGLYMNDDDLAANEIEHAALDETYRFVMRTQNTYDTLLTMLWDARPDREVSTNELVEVGLMESRFT